MLIRVEAPKSNPEPRDEAPPVVASVYAPFTCFSDPFGKYWLVIYEKQSAFREESHGDIERSPL
eukprot:9538574-Heterocapsa_arctica.AAC.1